jgi:hypothetical protein
MTTEGTARGCIADSAEIPPWVPQSVKQIALAFPVWKSRDGDPVGRRLLLDERMSGVWRELAKHTVKSLAYQSDWEKLEHWQLRQGDFSDQDRAFAAFFVRVVFRFCDGLPVRTRSDADADAKPYSIAGDTCWQEINSGLLLPELVSAYEAVKRDLAWKAEMRAGTLGNDATIVSRSAKLRADDRLRVGCRFIGGATSAIFGMSLVGQVKTIAEVIFQEQISERNVRNWVDDTSGG